MTWFPGFRRPPPDVASEVDEELDGHLAMRVDENLRRGLTPDDARREAERRLGARGPIARASMRIRGRRESALRAIRTDIRQTWLGLKRSPRLFICAAVVAAAGLATSLAAALVADALLLRVPAGIRDAGRLRSALDAFDGTHGVLMSYAFFAALDRGAPELQPFVWGDRDLQVIAGSSARVWNGSLVSGSYFDALGTRAAAGRLVSSADVASRRSVVVVSGRMALTFAADVSSALGRTLTVNGQPFDVIGVAERAFRGVEAGAPTDLWLPITVEPDVSTVNVFPDGHTTRGFLTAPDIGWLRGGIRLPPGTTDEAAAARLTAIARRVEASRPLPDRSVMLQARPWLSPFSGDRDRVDAVLVPIVWSVGLTLLLTAACLGSLFAGRVADRQRELGLRVALGAGRGRIARLVSFEVVAATGAGAILSIPAVLALLAAARDFQLTSGIRVADAAPPFDPRAAVLLSTFAAGVAICAAIAPLVLLRRSTPAIQTGSTRVTTSGGAVRRILVAAQVAVACALLSGSLQLTRTIAALVGRPLGFDAASVAYVELNPSGAGLDRAARAALIDRLLSAGGTMVALADEPPNGGESTMFAKGEDAAANDRFIAAWTTRIAGPYFETLGTSVVAGRAFTAADRDRPVVILSEPLVEWYWPHASPASAVGRRVRVGGPTGTDREIVGVVPGLRDLTLRASLGARLYLPLDEDTETLTVLARSPAPAAEATSVSARIRDMDSRLVPLRSGTLAGLMLRTVEQRQVFRFITGLVGVGSLVLIAVGVWGLAEATLRRRWREFGVRQALGATRRHVARLAMADAWFVAAIGGAAGVTAAWQFGRLLRAWLFGVTPSDPLSLATAGALVIAAAVLGAAWPARQAARLDAATLLRAD